MNTVNLSTKCQLVIRREVRDRLTLEAADISLEHGLAMSDAIIFATAAKHEASIVTADADFEGLPRVTLIR